MKEVFKIKNSTEVGKLAGAIASAIREEREVELRAMGAGAVNQAIKAIAVANGFLAPTGVNIAASSSFQEIESEEGPRTTMVIKIIKI